jgi:hypothetical protein
MQEGRNTELANTMTKERKNALEIIAEKDEA